MQTWIFLLFEHFLVSQFPTSLEICLKAVCRVKALTINEFRDVNVCYHCLHTQIQRLTSNLRKWRSDSEIAELAVHWAYAAVLIGQLLLS